MRADDHTMSLLTAVFDSVTDGIIVVDRKGLIARANNAAERILRYPAGALTGVTIGEVVPEESRARHAALVAGFSAVGPHIMGAHRQLSGLRHDGSRVPLEVTLTDLGATGAGAVCAVIRDVTERLAFEQQLVHQSLHDPLTGLGNRVVLNDHLERSLNRMSRTTRALGVLFADVDHFKSINDAYGHSAGDSILIELARRMSCVLRAGDTLVRLGGDEFAVICEDLDGDGREGLLDVAERLRQSVAAIWMHEGRELHPTISVGACSTVTPLPREHLLSNADLALYEAKRRGRDRVSLFEPTMRAKHTREQHLREELHRAVREGELTAYYQPLVHLSTRRVLGFEALVRWEHPTRGLLQPGAFLHLAEQEAGIIRALDTRVLLEACGMAARLSERDNRPYQAWVNMSGGTVSAPQLPREVGAALEGSGLPPGQLTLEISEGAALTDFIDVAESLRRLREAGVSIAVDDFGTGYSALAHLTRLPVSAVKLDRSFLDNPDDLAIIASIVGITHALRLLSVAEGIETVQQLDLLMAAGCQVGQGYHLARPMSAEALSAWLLDPGSLAHIGLSDRAGTKRRSRTTQAADEPEPGSPG
jgi:diguanylate cyclase (GGDEF)-like protein/PAS domain S-box-containing protein